MKAARRTMGKREVKKKSTKVSDWCDGSLTDIDQFMGDKPRPKKVRCPKCNRRLTQKITTCGDTDCWHLKVPQHKRSI